MSAMLPFVEQQHGQFCEPENQCCRKLRRKKNLYPLSTRERGFGRYELPVQRQPGDDRRLEQGSLGILESPCAALGCQLRYLSMVREQTGSL